MFIAFETIHSFQDIQLKITRYQLPPIILVKLNFEILKLASKYRNRHFHMSILLN